MIKNVTPVIISVVTSIPAGDNFIFVETVFKTPSCQFCTKMPEMSDLCYLQKPRVGTLHYQDTTVLLGPSLSKKACIY